MHDSVSCESEVWASQSGPPSMAKRDVLRSPYVAAGTNPQSHVFPDRWAESHDSASSVARNVPRSKPLRFRCALRLL